MNKKKNKIRRCRTFSSVGKRARRPVGGGGKVRSVLRATNARAFYLLANNERNVRRSFLSPAPVPSPAARTALRSVGVRADGGTRSPPRSQKTQVRTILSECVSICLFFFPPPIFNNRFSVCSRVRLRFYRCTYNYLKKKQLQYRVIIVITSGALIASENILRRFLFFFFLIYWATDIIYRRARTQLPPFRKFRARYNGTNGRFSERNNNRTTSG